MTRVEVCRGCPEYRPHVNGCALVTCLGCGGDEVPAVADFVRMLYHAAGKCRHPAGNKWRGIPPEPAPPPPPPDPEAVRVVTLQSALAAVRVPLCVRCENMAAGRCRLAVRGVAGLAGDPGFGCPAGHFSAFPGV